MTLGFGKAIDSTSAGIDYLMAPEMALLEEVGFGKAGLGLGTALGRIAFDRAVLGIAFEVE